jgi:hypothetical protein
METTTGKREYWKRIMERWQLSGISQKAYCANEGINCHNFAYWRRQIAKDGNGQDSGLTVVELSTERSVHAIGHEVLGSKITATGLAIPVVGSEAVVSIQGILTLEQLAHIVAGCQVGTGGGGHVPA